MTDKQEVTWHLEAREIGDLKDYEKNPRRATKKQLKHIKTSVQKYGLIDKPIVNLDNCIIGGHMHKHILKELGKTSVDVWVPDRQLDADEVAELNIRLNRGHAEFDYDMLAATWEVEELLELGFLAEEMGIATVDKKPKDLTPCAKLIVTSDSIDSLKELYDTLIKANFSCELKIK